MNNKELSEKLSESKNKLQLHIEKFNLLRVEGKPQEALKELKIALNFAAQTLQYSNSILRQISLDTNVMPQSARQDTLKQIDSLRTRKICSENPLLNIHIPSKKTIH